MTWFDLIIAVWGVAAIIVVVSYVSSIREQRDETGS